MSSIEIANGYILQPSTESQVFDFVNEHGAQLFDDDVYYLPDNYYTAIEKERKEKLKERFSNRVSLAYFIKKDSEIVGAFIGKGINEEDFEMWITAILPAHRRKGIYKHILPFAIMSAKELGFQRIISQHACTNNPVIIAKLKAGFVINGFMVNDKCGAQLTLIYHFNQLRKDMFAYRMGAKVPSAEMKIILGL